MMSSSASVSLRNFLICSSIMSALPIANFEASLSAPEQQMLNQMARCAAVGDADMIEEQIKKFLKETVADELIIVSSIFDHKARLHSYKLTAEVAGRII